MIYIDFIFYFVFLQSFNIGDAIVRWTYSSIKTLNMQALVRALKNPIIYSNMHKE